MNPALIIPQIMSFLVLVSNIIFLVVLALFIFSPSARKWIVNHISEKPVEHVFFFSLCAMLGSLAFSNIVGFPPCDLCWFQRIVMYPQVIITLVALLRKKVSQGIEVIYYCATLSVIGFLISLYQSYIQWGGTHSLLPCTLDGGACGKLYVYAYGYITIPFMALSVFTYLVCISFVCIYGNRKR